MTTEPRQDNRPPAGPAEPDQPGTDQTGTGPTGTGPTGTLPAAGGPVAPSIAADSAPPSRPIANQPAADPVDFHRPVADQANRGQPTVAPPNAHPPVAEPATAPSVDSATADQPAISPPGDTDLVEVGANHPRLLANPGLVWTVERGDLDVFAVAVVAGRPSGPRRFLFAAGLGSALFGLEPQAAGGLGLLVVGRPGTVIRRHDRSAFLSAIAGLTPAGGAEATDGIPPGVAAPPPAEAATSTVRTALDDWLMNLGSALAAGPPPAEVTWLEPGQPVAVSTGASVSAAQPLWLRIAGGRVSLRHRDDLSFDATNPPVPLTIRAGARVVEDLTGETLDTAALLQAPDGPAALDAFTGRALQAIAADIAADRAADRARFTASIQAGETAMSQALEHVAAVLTPDQAAGSSLADPDPAELILRACRQIGSVLGVDFRVPRGSLQAFLERDPIGTIALASRVRTRQVVLESGWWRGDHGPLLAFRNPPQLPPPTATDQPPDPPEAARQPAPDPRVLPEASRPDYSRPVALLPHGPNAYVLVDPFDGRRTRVTAEHAATLQETAVQFYRPFPETAIRLGQLLLFGLRDARSDLARTLGLGAAVSLLGLLVPVITGIVFGTIIPGARLGQLAEIAVLLTTAAFAGALFLLGQNIALLRVTGQLNGVLQAAVWDRLLALPAPFFRRFSAGDLVGRAGGIDAIRQILSGVTASSLLGVLLSIFNIAVLFAFSRSLALVAVVLVVVMTVTTGLFGVRLVRLNRTMFQVQGQIYGILYQYLQSIDKLRIAGAETRAFARWAERFQEQKRIAFEAGLVTNGLLVLNAVIPTLTALVIFAAAAANVDTGLSTPAFLAFSAAFGQFVVAVQQVNYSFVAALTIVPLYERLTPILETLPEIDATKTDPGTLAGRVRLDHVSFRYTPESPLVLDDVTIEAAPGEWIAIAGPSGSGKSSLIRLLLGFEHLASGGIYYDGQDLAQIDVRAVRRQIGVVLQNGNPMAGDLYHNIVGSSPLSLDEAWAAAAAAGLADDIKAMPMGMFTHVPEGGGTFSGGQIQRLLIARALATKPRLLFFDEATSALDNVTQAHVIQAVRSLRTTLISIAARLSTIEHADRIYVLDRGRVVETGTYAELMQRDGLFAAMAKRQLT